MTLLNRPLQVYAQLPKFFETLRAGTAPVKFNREFLKDVGFKSSNHLEFIPLLKGLGFLTADGTPTERYRNFLDGSRWKKIIAEAIRDAYGDIFVIKAKPTNSDLQMITGKFKSTYNLSDTQAERSAKTFLALLALADTDTLYGNAPSVPGEMPSKQPPVDVIDTSSLVQNNHVPNLSSKIPVGLNYNIQIHLPATKDIEVYNAIFKSLREHIID